MLEFVLVMVIIGTVLAMAAPSLRGFFASRKAADAAAHLVAMTHWARSQALAEGRTYRLHLDAGSGTYRLSREGPAGDEPIASEQGRTFHLPDGTTLRWKTAAGLQERGTLSFAPDGRTQTATLHLRTPQTEPVAVVCRSALEPCVVETEAEPW